MGWTGLVIHVGDDECIQSFDWRNLKGKTEQGVKDIGTV
jgi:hypothetical protein